MGWQEVTGRQGKSRWAGGLVGDLEGCMGLLGQRYTIMVMTTASAPTVSR